MALVADRGFRPFESSFTEPAVRSFFCSLSSGHRRSLTSIDPTRFDQRFEAHEQCLPPFRDRPILARMLQSAVLETKGSQGKGAVCCTSSFCPVLVSMRRLTAQFKYKQNFCDSGTLSGMDIPYSVKIVESGCATPTSFPDRLLPRAQKSQETSTLARVSLQNAPKRFQLIASGGGSTELAHVASTTLMFRVVLHRHNSSYSLTRQLRLLVITLKRVSAHDKWACYATILDLSR